MGAIRAFDVTAGAMKRNPVLFAAAALVAVAGTVVNTTGQLSGLLGLAVGLLYVFVEPLLAGGYLGMANEAVDGETSMGSFLQHATDNYADLLIARLVVGVPLVVYAFAASLVATFVIGVAVMGAVGAGSGGEPNASAILGAVGLVSLVVMGLVLLVPAVVGFFLQFYPAAIVLGGAGPLESFRYSVRIVRQFPVSVLGYTAVAFVFGLLLVAPGVLSGGGGLAARLLVAGATESPLAGLASGLLARLAVFAATFVVLKALVVYFVRTYYVSFVRAVSGTA